MNSFIWFAQASGGGGAIQEIARTFGVDWPHLIAQMISFSIVCLVLYKFAYRRVLATLEQRRKVIDDGLANTEKIKTEAARTEAQRQEVIALANRQATQLIEEARAAAARVQQQETSKAVASAEEIVSKAQQAAARDHDRILAEVEREVGRLVIQSTATVTGKVLTSEDQRLLAQETNKVLAA